MIDRISGTLTKLFSESVSELNNAMTGQVLDGLFGLASAKRQNQNLARINLIYNRMERLFAAFSAAEAKRQYDEGVNIAAEVLKISDTTSSIDAKTLGIFVQEMLDDFTRGTNGARKTIGTFFVFSKQGVLTENEMTEIMAKGWIKQGTGREGMRDIAAALRSKLETSPMTRLTPKEMEELADVALKKYIKAGVPPQFLQSMKKMLMEDKFLRLINKNGDPMHFRVNKYAELVARTRTGNAQVHGTIEQANAYGVTEFQVTTHNTETEICKPHEGKIYTTDPNNTRFEYLSPANRPLYHILCKHRLLPRAFTKAKLELMPHVRGPGIPESVPQMPQKKDPDQPAKFPESLEGLRDVRQLGGSTGARLVEDPATGQKFVMKRGASADHIREEFLADEMYQAMGANVPKARLYESPQGPVKLAQFIEGENLGSAMQKATGQKLQTLKAQLQKDFATDSLLGNWDVAGMNMDNILVDRRGTVWRIDNGGALRFRAQGGLKDATDWGEYPTELWSMRKPAFGVTNSSAASIFGEMNIYDVAHGIDSKNFRPLLAKAPDGLKETIEKRLENMQSIARKALEFEADKWKALYADDVTMHMMGMRRSGLTKYLPEVLTNEGVNIKDGKGIPWDFMRSKASSAMPDPFYSDILSAIKTVAGHNAKGDFAYNQATIARALSHKPELDALFAGAHEESRKMAQQYLGALNQIERSVEAGKTGIVLPITKFEKFVRTQESAQSIIHKLRDYMAANGGDWEVVSDWAKSQKGSSWSQDSFAYKWFLANQRDVPLDNYFWYNFSQTRVKSVFDAKPAVFGQSMTMHHAFIQEFLSTTNFAFNDRKLRVVRLTRTEAKTNLTRAGLQYGKALQMARGANESASIYAKVSISGSELTIQAVPHIRITGSYFFERFPGHGEAMFMSDGENEFLFIPEGIPFDYVRRILYNGSIDARRWGVSLDHVPGGT